MAEARRARGWAMYAPAGWIFTDSVRSRRSEVIDYANNDAAPGWNWNSYRKRGFFIAKVEIVLIGAPTSLSVAPPETGDSGI